MFKLLDCVNTGKFHSREEDITWIFTSVYGPVSCRERVNLWEEIGAIRGLWSEPWCMGGYFNTKRFPNESNRAGNITKSIRDFSEVIEDLELNDILI